MKTHAWLLAVSFIPFSIFGFLFAQFSTHGIRQPDPTIPTVAISEVRTQTNILFISVDTQAKPNPRLVSAWGLFISTMNQNVAEIIPLYPSKEALKDTVLLSEFFLTQGKVLDPKFVDLTQKAFEVKWDAYIVINQDEIGKISKQLEKDAKIKDSDSASSGLEAILLQQLCSTLKSTGMTIDLSHILDTQILDTNFSSSLLASYDQWKKTGQPFSSCEVQQ
jgi:hypothetical protein